MTVSAMIMFDIAVLQPALLLTADLEKAPAHPRK